MYIHMKTFIAACSLMFTISDWWKWNV